MGGYCGLLTLWTTRGFRTRVNETGTRRLIPNPRKRSVGSGGSRCVMELKNWTPGT